MTIDTDAQLLAADEVIAAIATESGRPADDVRESLSVTARPLTRILEITYSDRSASSAPAGAAGGGGFLAARDRIVIQPVREYLSEVAKENQQLEETRNVLEETNSTIDGTRLVEWQERAVLAELEVPGPGSVVGSRTSRRLATAATSRCQW